jgi:hypothetical protein
MTIEVRTKQFISRILVVTAPATYPAASRMMKRQRLYLPTGGATAFLFDVKPPF